MNKTLPKLALFVGISLLAYSRVGGGLSLTNILPQAPDEYSNVIDREGRQFLSERFLGLADAIEEDAARPEDEQYTPNKEAANEDLFHVLHQGLGPNSSKLGEKYSQLPALIENKMGQIDEWPAGRTQFVQKLRQIAEELY